MMKRKVNEEDQHTFPYPAETAVHYKTEAIKGDKDDKE